MDEPYDIWIEAEVWTPDSWTPTDCNADILVTFADGSRWVATCFTYANVMTLTTAYRSSGDLLAGRYFWASDMVLVERLDRPFVEALVRHLLQEQTFATIFRWVAPESDDYSVTDGIC